MSPSVQRSSDKGRQRHTGGEEDDEKGTEKGLSQSKRRKLSREGRCTHSNSSLQLTSPLTPPLWSPDLTLKYPAGMESEPELSDLMDQIAVHIPDKWRDIGIALGLTTIECFSAATMGDPSRCFSSVFTIWKSRMTREPYGWGTVVQALRAPSVGELRLAEQLEKRLTKSN